MIEYIKTWILSLEPLGGLKRELRNCYFRIDQLEKQNAELRKEKHAWMRHCNPHYFKDKQ